MCARLKSVTTMATKPKKTPPLCKKKTNTTARKFTYKTAETFTMGRESRSHDKTWKIYWKGYIREVTSAGGKTLSYKIIRLTRYNTTSVALKCAKVELTVPVGTHHPTSLRQAGIKRMHKGKLVDVLQKYSLPETIKIPQRKPRAKGSKTKKPKPPPKASGTKKGTHSRINCPARHVDAMSLPCTPRGHKILHPDKNLACQALATTKYQDWDNKCT